MKKILSPKEVIVLLNKVGARVNNTELSLYFNTKGIVISPNSIRSIKAHINRS